MSPYTLLRPQPGAIAIPFVCDSPHSGTTYPDDFQYSVDLAALRRSEDTHIDALWSAVPRLGGTLLAATFPRSYIDPNRVETDVDVNMLSGTWARPVAPSKLCLEQGNGLVWRLTPEYVPIYSRLLSTQELADRIDNYWRPYRQALEDALDQAAQEHGCWWHLNLHSMPSNAYERLRRTSERELADVVLGDLDGTTCSPEFRDVVSQAFRSKGYSVSVNDPYKGQDLIRMAGRPTQNGHSLQVEINRALYMDEANRQPTAGFTTLKADIDLILNEIASFVRGRLIHG